MEVQLSQTSVKEWIRQIGDQMSVQPAKDCLEYCVEIPSQYGNGKIMALEFDHGLSLLLFDCQLKSDFYLSWNEQSSFPLNLNYCIEGGLTHRLNDNDILYQLQPLLGTIVANPSGTSQQFEFPANKDLLLTSLFIDREAYTKKIDCEIDKMPERLASAFSDTRGTSSFMYQSNYSISIAQCIKKITRNSYKGLVRSTFLESKTLELLSMQIKQYNDDQNMPSQQVLLRKYDVNKIIEAKDKLIENLQDPPTIIQLSKEVGINQQKLKQGFKVVFDTTINRYLRHERMETARLLLVEGSMNIKTIATMVGYSNKSHFSRRFKEKFGVLPKDYLKTMRTRLPDNIQKHLANK